MTNTDTKYTNALHSLHRLMDEAEDSHASYPLSLLEEAVDTLTRAYECLTAVQEKRAELGLDD